MDDENSHRPCGSCSMCCKLFHIEEVDWQKLVGQWCKHCRPGRGGCMIYEARPQTCIDFVCLWKGVPPCSYHLLPEAARPDRCKVVFQEATGTDFGITAHSEWLGQDKDPVVQKIILALLNVQSQVFFFVNGEPAHVYVRDNEGSTVRRYSVALYRSLVEAGRVVAPKDFDKRFEVPSRV